MEYLASLVKVQAKEYLDRLESKKITLSSLSHLKQQRTQTLNQILESIRWLCLHLLDSGCTSLKRALTFKARRTLSREQTLALPLLKQKQINLDIEFDHLTVKVIIRFSM